MGIQCEKDHTQPKVLLMGHELRSVSKLSPKEKSEARKKEWSGGREGGRKGGKEDCDIPPALTLSLTPMNCPRVPHLFWASAVPCWGRTRFPWFQAHHAVVQNTGRTRILWPRLLRVNTGVVFFLSTLMNPTNRKH